MVSISVGDLTALPHATISALAGHRGLERMVTWAQVVDIPSPWDWLDPGDLVITSGGIVPVTPDAQAHFVERMAAAGLSGLLVGDDPLCAPISAAMLQAADRCGFPVLLADYQTSWIEIVRLVARANLTTEGQTLSSIMRVHNEMRVGLVTSRTSSEVLAALGKVVGHPLSVIDPTTCEPLLPGIAPLDPGWARDVATALDNHRREDRRGAVPLITRVQHGDETALAIPIPVAHSAMLFVRLGSRETPKLAVLQHVAAACALEMTRIDAHLEKARRAGSAVMSEALQGHLAPGILAAHLDDFGLEAPYACLAIESSAEQIDTVARRWAVRGIPHLMSGVGPVYSVLLPSAPSLVDELRVLAARQDLRIGMSEPFSTPAALGDAGKQARWALETMPRGGAALALYGEDTESFLPRTLLECEHTVDRVLGALLDYDAQNDGELVKTLRAYLECDRSPKRTAAVLFVHNQTVNYRISRIQEITGRSLRATADVSEFWFALRALALRDTAPRRGRAFVPARKYPMHDVS